MSSNSKQLIWLSSYPKSGNTWVRLFLAALVSENHKAVDQSVSESKILLSEDVPVMYKRDGISSVVGLDLGDFNEPEIFALRAEAYASLNQSLTAPVYIKVHDAYTSPYGQKTLFAPSITRGAIYLVRNPLDTVISYSHQSQASIDQAIATFNRQHSLVFQDEEYRSDMQTRQFVSDWSGHVKSWCQTSSLSPLLVRFEDLLAEPTKWFSEIVRYLALPASKQQIASAIERVSFASLQQKEQEQGFAEIEYYGQQFFRKGAVGEWQSVLSSEQVKLIISNHREVMKWLAYIDENDQPTQDILSSVVS